MNSLSQRGFTLIELIIVIVILSVISVVVAKIMFAGFSSFTVSQNISEVDSQGFLALESLVNDVHNIQSANSITTLSATQISFVDASGNSVQYTLSGNSLLRNSQILASGVTGLNFSYLDSAGTVTAVPSSTRYVSIAITFTQGNLASSFSTLVGTRGMS